MKITIVDAQIGEVIEREMTPEELADFNAQNEAYAEQKAQEQFEKEAKAQAKSAILEKLGLTEDEAKVLLG
jgi:hypothetical protein